ncbi:MAG: hypothetical protein EOP38_16470 [Rubrivivax sp.]|nr:MAG: hypothetical protein EOP38_16470 [Rubrivivax sp.]
MKTSRLTRPARPMLATAALIGALSSAAQAESTMFPKGPPMLARNQFFMRIGYLHIFTKTQSGEVKDLSGPVVTADDLAAGAAYGDALPSTHPLSPDNFDGRPGLTYTLAVNTLRPDINREIALNGGTGLGAPPGLKAKAGNSSAVALNLGYWLNDDFTWAVEAYIAAAPLSVKVYGQGLNESGRPNGISDKEVLTTKILPPLVQFGRYFGGKDSMFRPYVGLGAMYAMFFDTRATSSLNAYAGGSTQVSLKNAFGVGPFVGLKTQISDDWFVHVSAGQITIKTTAKLTTTNTTIRSGAAILRDYNPTLVSTIAGAERLYDSQLTTKLLQATAASKGQSDLGAHRRKLDTKLTNTILSIGVGYNF